MIARVIIDSPLPQLDRVFDYQIPAELEGAVVAGCRVLVPFGRSKTAYAGFVIAVVDSSDFDGKLAEIESLTSSFPALDPNIYRLVRAVADRQAVTASDVLRHAVPDRSVAVEKNWISANTVINNRDIQGARGRRSTALVQPLTTVEGPVWVSEILKSIAESVANSQSVIVLVPDFRDQAAIWNQLSHSMFSDIAIDYSSATQKSKRYESFLRCFGQEFSVVIGSRSAIYAPVRNLGKIIVWDDGDFSHLEQSSPYTHTRDVALLRQQQELCDLMFLGHSRSTEVQRLVSIKFLEDETKPFPLPRIANSDSEIRVDSLAWRNIRSALENGPVLVQVSSRGQSTSAYCAECSTRSQCKECNGPLWIDDRNFAKCRWCNAVNLDHQCHLCNSQKLKLFGSGAARTVNEFGKAFPNTKIIEANAETRGQDLRRGKFLVVATPGAEPNVLGGYSAVIILDAQVSLSRDTLRATEDSVRQWSNAIALAGPEAQNVLVGVQGQLAQKFSLWSQREISTHELQNRAELRFPPAIRLASIGASKELIQQISEEVTALGQVEMLGPLPIIDRGQSIEWRLLLKYEYGAGAALAMKLKTLALKMSSGQSRVSSKSGRTMRPIRIKMDDTEVI